MKKEYSKNWIASSQPRKQRKFLAKAPLHKKRRLLSVNLSKDLRSKHNTRNVVLRKGDKVKILRGKYKGKEGKVTKVNTKLSKIYIEGIQTKKQDGSMTNVPLRASNLQIVNLVLEDKKRLKKIETPKKEIKSVTKEKEE
jgi:large subunit ribosomal protein L24